jgi:mannose-6-phosphate isomerase-like protein (cupin superfamily)
MRIINMEDYPFELFGERPTRKVRLPVSPETSGDRITITYVVVPPKGVSEGHIHQNTDEYIYFDIGGATIIDGMHIEVFPHSIVLAQAGEEHECINTSSTTELRLFCVYTPPMELTGRFVELAKKTKAFLSIHAGNREGGSFTT